jgi:hypothetical protein
MKINLKMINHSANDNAYIERLKKEN